jgi:hypothetical protein
MLIPDYNPTEKKRKSRGQMMALDLIGPLLMWTRVSVSVTVCTLNSIRAVVACPCMGSSSNPKLAFGCIFRPGTDVHPPTSTIGMHDVMHIAPAPIERRRSFLLIYDLLI